MEAPAPIEADTGADDVKPSRWVRRIDEAMNAEKTWRKKGREVVGIYRSSRTADGSEGRGRYNMLFANVSILGPAVYQQPPQADVRRRFARPDQMADDAASVIQGALNVSFDAANLDAEIKRAVQDVLLPGRGLIRLRWSPVMQDVPAVDAAGAPVMGEDGQPVTRQEKAWETVDYEQVYWEDFTCEPVRRWSACTWVAFRHFLTKAEVEKEFGDDEQIAALLEDAEWVAGAFVHSSLDTDQRDRTEHKGAVEPRALIWECWDKSRRVIDWIAPSQTPMLLRRDDDFLELRNFFPCPEPILSVSTTDTMIPVPEYEIYQDLAAEIARQTERIDAIMKRMKVRGLFNGTIEELVDAFEGDDGQMIAANGVDMGGMAQNVWMIPLDLLAAAAVSLFNGREQTKVALYEVTGISDVLRGSSQSGETATAQRIKGNFGTLRIDDRRRGLATMLKGVVEIAAEIMASKFSARTLSMMTGREVTSELEEYLRNEAQLMCLVDVETDSTIASDEAVEQENVTKLVTSLGGLMQTFGPMMGEGKLPLPVLVELMKMVLKPFKGSRDLLDILGQLAEQAAQQPQEPPPPDPAVEKAKAELELKRETAQQDMQIKAETHAADMQQRQADMAMRGQEHEAQMTILAQRAAAPQPREAFR